MADKEFEFTNEMITKDEFLKLSEACRRDGEIDEAEVEKLVKWVTRTRTSAACIFMLLEGYLTLANWNGDEPEFQPELTEDELRLFGRLEEDRALEESRC